MKRILFTTIAFAAILNISAQKKKKVEIKRDRHEIEKEMPAFLDRIKEELTYPLAWQNTNQKKYSKWQKQAREKVFECMLTPPVPAKDFAPEVIATEQRDGYKALKIEFNITDYSRIPAYVLVPDGEGEFPAVALFHDHGAHFGIGKEKMIRPFGVDSLVLNDADKWANICYDDQYVGDYLASKGYVVISIDALFWGERGRKEGVEYDSQQAVACNFEMLGRSWSGHIAYEDIYTIDFLESLPYVDKNRIGCFGFSMGAYRAWMTAALTDKVKAGAAICWITTTDSQLAWNARVNKGGSGFSMVLPGVRNYLDYPHIASIACPKPMLFFNGAKDKLFPVDGVNDAYSTLHEVWESQNAAANLETKIWDLPHFCSKDIQKEVADFYDKNLK